MGPPPNFFEKKFYFVSKLSSKKASPPSIPHQRNTRSRAIPSVQKASASIQNVKSPRTFSTSSTSSPPSSSQTTTADCSLESIKRPFSSLSPPLLGIDSQKILKKKSVSHPTRLPQPSANRYSSTVIDTQFTTNDTSVLPTFDQKTPMETLQVDLDTTVPDWALNFQAQFRQLHAQLGLYDSRLANVQNLAIENAKLRAELTTVKTALSEALNSLRSTTSTSVTPSPSPATAKLTATDTPKVFAVTQPPVSPSAASRAKPTTAEFTVVKRKRKSKKPVPPTPAALAAFSRKFSPASDPSSSNGYRFVYYKAIKRPLSWYRTELLPMIGVNDSRVLDIHFPTQRVAAFLLHSDFILDFTSIMHKKLKLDPLLDFDPLENRNLLDPALSSLDTVSRSAKLHNLQNLRVLRALTFTRPSVRVSIAKSMLLQDFIGQAQFNAILADTLTARAAQTPAPTANAAEEKERKRVRVEYLFNLHYLDPISAMTVPSAPPLNLPAASNTAHANDALNEMQDC